MYTEQPLAVSAMTSINFSFHKNLTKSGDKYYDGIGKGVIIKYINKVHINKIVK